MGKHALKDVNGFVSRRDFFFVDPRVLVVEAGFNPRDNIGDEEDKELMASIIATGVEVPLKVQKVDGDRLIIREGHRRHWACMEAIKEGVDIKSVPVMLTDRNLSPDRALIMSLNCNTGRRLSPVEEGLAFERLLKYGYQVKHIADSVGKSLSFVYDRLKLVNVTPEVKAAMEAGAVSIRAAATAAGKAGADPERQNAILKAEKPKPVRIAWDKKESDFFIKGQRDGLNIDHLPGILADEMAGYFDRAGLDITTLKISILPKADEFLRPETSNSGSKNGTFLTHE